VNRAELGVLRDAIDTILTWPDSVRGQVAHWLQTDASKPNGADPGRVSRSRSNRRPGSKPSVEEVSAREQALLEAMRDQPDAGVSSGRRQPAATKAPSPCGSADWPSAASSSGTAAVAGGSPE
jgi:hypothetical protein